MYLDSCFPDRRQRDEPNFGVEVLYELTEKESQRESVAQLLRLFEKTVDVKLMHRTEQRKNLILS